MRRPVTIVADDYGIGRATSCAILDLACSGRITATVLLVNAPDAEQAAREWSSAAPPADLGWHPNLTLDSPILEPALVPSLVRANGKFWPLTSFLRRVLLGQIRFDDVRREWQAQYRRFVELVGRPPALVNSHQHVSLFPPCNHALIDVLEANQVRPYLRRVVEKGDILTLVPGSRIKRALLSVLGRRVARYADARGLPGCDWLVGISNLPREADGRFLHRWLEKVSATGSVEFCCHPGYYDPSLSTREGEAKTMRRREQEVRLLQSSSFHDAYSAAGFVATRPSLLGQRQRGTR